MKLYKMLDSKFICDECNNQTKDGERFDLCLSGEVFFYCGICFHKLKDLLNK